MFHVCCLVHAARENARPNDEESCAINHGNSDSITRVVPPVTRKNPIGDSVDINLRAVGCAINRQTEDDIRFYIRADTEDWNSVFVLDRKIESGKQTLVVSEHISGIPNENKNAVYLV